MATTKAGHWNEGRTKYLLNSRRDDAARLQRVDLGGELLLRGER
jgi:hypothetical protein